MKAGKQKKPLQKSLRIIAGKWRGRKISFLESRELRPTSDRIRETLFNWLQNEIDTYCCLDLFAGSGALGLEALSRGASSLSFVEQDSTSAQKIRENLSILGEEKQAVFHMSAEQFLKQHALDDYQLIFLDPPYALFSVSTLIALLEQHFHSSQTCRVFYEHDTDIDKQALPENWIIEKKKKAGNVYFFLLKRTALNP